MLRRRGSCCSGLWSLAQAWLSPAAVGHWLPAIGTHLPGKAVLCLAAQVPSPSLLQGSQEALRDSAQHTASGPPSARKAGDGPFIRLQGRLGVSGQPREQGGLSLLIKTTAPLPVSPALFIFLAFTQAHSLSLEETIGRCTHPVSLHEKV